MTAPHPLIARLAEAGCPVLETDAIAAFLAPPGLALLLITGDPAQRREALDVAVVLKELLDRYAGRVRAAVAARGAEPALQTRFRAPVVPTLLLLREGEPVARLPRIRDWADYLAAIDAALAVPATPHDAA
jgi:hydrogenase-1 operon protein HyaE